MGILASLCLNILLVCSVVFTDKEGTETDYTVKKECVQEYFAVKSWRGLRAPRNHGVQVALTCGVFFQTDEICPGEGIQQNCAKDLCLALLCTLVVIIEY